MSVADPGEALGFGMTDLEEMLAGPEGQQVGQRLEERFATLIEAYSQRLQGGLHPDEFKRCEAILGALASAREIVIAFPKG